MAPTRRRLYPLLAASAAGIVLFPVVAAVVDPGRERTPPDDAQAHASLALARARTAGAPLAAPMSLSLAEWAYAEALLERRRQELGFRLYRDYRETRRRLEEATAAATTSMAVVDALRRRAESRSSNSVALAEAVLAPLTGVEDQIWLAPTTRTRLQRARALASEGASLVESGAYDAAAARGDDAHRAALDVSRSVWAVTERYLDPEHLRAWKSWTTETVSWSARTGRAAIVIDKDEHTLTLYHAGKVAQRYAVELGWNNAADKRHQGDGATPEGRYHVVELKGRSRSRYHRALLLDYPNAEDLRTLDRLKREGRVPRGTHAGGLIEIHGGGGRGKDWTDGCVAVTDQEVAALFTKVAVGTPVTIVGSGTGAGVFAVLARSVRP